MTVREYIGARYVPLFMGDWDNTLTYEPLSIVQDSGNSYTSRQYVPAGIDISNTTYWACTGNYNAQIDAYRAEVAAYNGRINTLEGNLPIADFDSVNTVKAAIDAEATARANAIDAIEDIIPASSYTSASTVKDAIDAEATARIAADNALGTRIDNINAVCNPYDYFDGYNCVIIGDSYAYGTGCSDHLSGDTKRWSTILCGLLGATEFNYAVGSTGWCDPGSGGQNAPFSTQVNTALSGMSSAQIANTHLVVIAGGVNDFNEGATYSASDMQSGAATACARAESGFPNAIILTVPMLFKGHGANPRLLNFENAIINGVNGVATGHKRCVYIQGAWTWNFAMASHYASDELHPNDLGHKNIANRIYANIMGGSAYENRLCTPVWETGYTGSVDQGTYFEFHDGVCQMYGCYITGSLTNGTTTKIGTCSRMAPNQTAWGVIAKASNLVGLWEITNSGAIYCKATTDVSTDFFLQPISYIPMGKLA